jgi:hypothetical protein
MERSFSSSYGTRLPTFWLQQQQPQQQQQVEQSFVSCTTTGLANAVDNLQSPVGMSAVSSSQERIGLSDSIPSLGKYSLQ